MKTFTLLLLILITSISACATGPGYTISQDWPENELAEVSIYRTNTFFHSANPERPFFYIDGKLVAKLGTGMAVTTKVKAGKHTVSVKQSFLFMPANESDVLEYNFESGKTYYLRYSKDFSGIDSVGNTFVATGSSSFVLADKENFEKRQ